MIELKNISKTYNPNRENKVEALKGLDLVLPDTGIMFLMGESGSGKTTLLNIMSSIERPSSGEIIIDNKNLSKARETTIYKYRNKDIGIIFQNYNLLQDETVSSNILLALELQGRKKLLKSKANVEEVLDKVGLSGYGNRKITQLSGGQQQRVAIARALVKSPKIIFADEPTGNLDSETSESIMEIFKGLSSTRLVVIVCHDLDLANKYADRIITLKDGSIEKDEVFNVRHLLNTYDKKQERKKRAKKLPFARRLKFAFKNLWAIKFRLMVVILLLGFSIATAGVGMIAKRYDREVTRANAYGKSGVGTLIIREKDLYEKDSLNNPIDLGLGYLKQKLMSEDKIDGLEKISNNEYYKIYGLKSYPEQLLITGDFSKLPRFGFNVVAGRYPYYSGESAVSLSWAEDCMRRNPKQYGTTLEEYLAEVSTWGIVGVIDCNVEKLEQFAGKVYSNTAQKDMLTHIYLEKERERGRTKFIFVPQCDMDKYANNFSVYTRFNLVYKISESLIIPLKPDLHNDLLEWQTAYNWEEKNYKTMEYIDYLLSENQLRNYRYIGKNPEELEEDEIVFTMFDEYSSNGIHSNAFNDIESIIVDVIQKEKGDSRYNVSKQEMLDYLQNNQVECEMQLDSFWKNHTEASITTKKMKIVGVLLGDWYFKDDRKDEDIVDFVYSQKLDLTKETYNNYGLIGYLANVGKDLEKDKQLLNYCEANDLDYNGIIDPYLKDADDRTNFLLKISKALTAIFAAISIIILMNLTLTCVQKTYKQVGLLRALGSGVADNIGIYILQGIICGILVALVATLLFPIMVNLCASGAGLSFLEPIFKGVSDLIGDYSTYLDKIINILPMYSSDYIWIAVVGILSTTIFTVLPLIFRLNKKPIEFLREEGDL